MENNVLILLPNQLFEKLPKYDFEKIILWEHPKFFKSYNFHKSKLLFHRVTMKEYYDKLNNENKKTNIEYVDFNKKIKTNKKHHLIFYDPVDHEIEKEMSKLSKKFKGYTMLNSKLFMETREELEKYAKGKKRFTHNSFYTWQRKRLNILVNNKKKPEGDKWSYDVENREKFPDGFKQDFKVKNKNTKAIKEEKKYIEKHFKNNFGESNIYLPTNHKDSIKHLKQFIKKRLACFGPYQDAVNPKILFGCHSVISPMLNIGLLDTVEVINEIVKHYNKNKSKKLLTSAEGIVRQIIGWRAYVRLLYYTKSKDLEKMNFFGHKKKLTEHWYNGTLGIPPVDDIIKKTEKIAYAHHIERLMYLGNSMLLMQIDPKEIYRWFMEVYLDAYDWVMLPNVHGMSQFSAGNLMMTRPYFSSSNYIVNMSSYGKTKDASKIKLDKEEYYWHDVWDALYYNFISDNYKFLSKNYSTVRSTAHWKNKSKSEQNKLIKLAKLYLKKY